jgi:hypothetical protein
MHYESLTSYFKWLVGIFVSCVTIFGATVAFSTYSSVKEYKDDIRTNMSEIKSDIKDIKVESIATIRSNREDVEKMWRK